MRKKFVIIGLTGAIGSGCKKISKFISHDLANNKERITTDLEKINTSIREHFVFIKTRINDFNKEQTQTDFGPYMGEDLSAYLSKMTGSNAKQLENELKVINKNLRELLIRRKILQYANKKLGDSFIQISMSSLLVKLMLEHINDDNVNAYFDQKNTPRHIIDFLKENHGDIQNLIKNFNEACEYKKWEKNDYKDFDSIFDKIKEIKNSLFSKLGDCREFFQDAGDNARATGNPFDGTSMPNYKNLSILAQEANKFIKYIRSKEKNNKDSSCYFIINSFRNPAEVQFFRKRYGSFFLASLYASKETRRNNLKEGKLPFDDMCDDRDAGIKKKSEELNKQDVPRCTLLADYAITTDSCNTPEKSEEHYKFEAIRFLSLIDFPGLVPPRNDEEVMNLAYSLSLRSTCLSRQVGAVITNPEGFIIAAGWNSVGSGQLGCSQLCVDDYTSFSDNGCLLSNWSDSIKKFKAEGLIGQDGSDCICFKDLQSRSKLNDKINNVTKKAVDNEPNTQAKNIKNEYSAALKKDISVKRLEYARALHAEENAILQAARFGGTGIAGGTIYTTTYPCELCSKKIYQAQLSRIVYTEPYPDSLSETLFLKDGIRQISIEQFEGVKSPSFFRLFKPAFDLKEYQTIDDHGADEDL